MKRLAILFSIFIICIILNAGYCKVVRVNLDHIKEHRKKMYVDLIDTLGELDPKHANVSAIFDRIQNLEKNSVEILQTVPDNGNSCYTKVKYRLNETIRRLNVLCDLCIADNNSDATNTSNILNENQKKCLDETLLTAQTEIDAIKPQAAESVNNGKFRKQYVLKIEISIQTPSSLGVNQKIHSNDKPFKCYFKKRLPNKYHLGQTGERYYVQPPLPEFLCTFGYFKGS